MLEPNGYTRTPLLKKLIFALVPLLMLLLLLETIGRFVFFQQRSEHSTAVATMLDGLFEWSQQAAIAASAESFAKQRDEGLDVPREVREKRYAELFDLLVVACRDADARLAVVFVPPPPAPGSSVAGSFFASLAAERNIPFLDLGHALGGHAAEVTRLLPEDGHLSRFGNILVARSLLSFLQPMSDHRTSVAYEERPEQLGDLEPAQDQIFWYGAPLPCRLVTNTQGLRRFEDVAFPRSQRTRVLCVGDSYTFGDAVHNPHTFPHLLESMAPDMEVLNAGVAGYTICDEYSYFMERGRYLEPDIVLLQVCLNDIDGLAIGLQRMFCRGGEHCPTRGQR